MAILWTNDLATGNGQIDSEHKQLIKAASELMEACGQGRGRQEIGHAVEFLSNYTKTHFTHEEELQQKFRFPGYAAHRSWHQSYIREIEAVMEKLKTEGPTIAVVAEVNMKLSQLLTHIKTADLKLAQYIGTCTAK